MQLVTPVLNDIQPVRVSIPVNGIGITNTTGISIAVVLIALPCAACIETPDPAIGIQLRAWFHTLCVGYQVFFLTGITRGADIDVNQPTRVKGK